MQDIPLKPIVYRGGIVRFRIPANWVEEYEEAGGGTFYQPSRATGTLRLNVLTIEAPPGQTVTAQTPAEVLKGEGSKYNAPIVPLREGVAMTSYDLPAEEDGHRLQIRFWRVAQALPPKNVRIALFSYTLLADQFDDPAFTAELATLDREIAGAELAPILGQTPPRKNRPWWRVW